MATAPSSFSTAQSSPPLIPTTNTNNNSSSMGGIGSQLQRNLSNVASFLFTSPAAAAAPSPTISSLVAGGGGSGGRRKDTSSSTQLQQQQDVEKYTMINWVEELDGHSSDEGGDCDTMMLSANPSLAARRRQQRRSHHRRHTTTTTSGTAADRAPMIFTSSSNGDDVELTTIVDGGNVNNVDMLRRARADSMGSFGGGGGGGGYSSGGGASSSSSNFNSSVDIDDEFDDDDDHVDFVSAGSSGRGFHQRMNGQRKPPPSLFTKCIKKGPKKTFSELLLSCRGALNNITDDFVYNVQMWLAAGVLGILAAFTAAIAELGTQWLSDLKIGRCADSFWSSENECCRHYQSTYKVTAAAAANGGGGAENGGGGPSSSSSSSSSNANTNTIVIGNLRTSASAATAGGTIAAATSAKISAAVTTTNLPSFASASGQRESGNFKPLVDYFDDDEEDEERTTDESNKGDGNKGEDQSSSEPQQREGEDVPPTTTLVGSSNKPTAIPPSPSSPTGITTLLLNLIDNATTSDILNTTLLLTLVNATLQLVVANETATLLPATTTVPPTTTKTTLPPTTSLAATTTTPTTTTTAPPQQAVVIISSGNSLNGNTVVAATTQCPAFVEWSVGDPTGLFGLIMYTFFAVVFATLSAYLCFRFAPLAAGSGVVEMKTILSGVRIPGFLDVRVLIVKTIGLMFSVGSGMTLGKEGPFVHLGSCLANLTAKMFPRYRDSEAQQRELLSSGAAVGVAVAFGAPIGGVLFSLEEVSYYFPHRTMLQAFFAAIVGDLVLKRLDVNHTGHAVQLSSTFYNPQSWHWFELGSFAVLGAVGGLIGCFINWLNSRVVVFRRQQKTHQITEVMVTALLTSLLAYLSTTSRYGMLEVLGALFDECESYHSSSISSASSASGGGGNSSTYTSSSPIFTSPIKAAICHDSDARTVMSLLFSAVIRTFLMAVTFGMKLPAGCFVPSLFIGGCVGRIVGMWSQNAVTEHLQANWASLVVVGNNGVLGSGTSNGGASSSSFWLFSSIFPSIAEECLSRVSTTTSPIAVAHSCINPAIYAAVGAAAVLAGVTRMTICLVVIMLEVIGGLDHIVPCMVAVVVAKWVADSSLVGIPSIYDVHLHFTPYPYIDPKEEFNEDGDGGGGGKSGKGNNGGRRRRKRVRDLCLFIATSRAGGGAAPRRCTAAPVVGASEIEGLSAPPPPIQTDGIETAEKNANTMPSLQATVEADNLAATINSLQNGGGGGAMMVMNSPATLLAASLRSGSGGGDSPTPPPSALLRSPSPLLLSANNNTNSVAAAATLTGNAGLCDNSNNNHNNHNNNNHQSRPFPPLLSSSSSPAGLCVMWHQMTLDEVNRILDTTDYNCYPVVAFTYMGQYQQQQQQQQLRRQRLLLLQQQQQQPTAGGGNGGNSTRLSSASARNLHAAAGASSAAAAAAATSSSPVSVVSGGGTFPYPYASHYSIVGTMARVDLLRLCRRLAFQRAPMSSVVQFLPQSLLQQQQQQQQQTMMMMGPLPMGENINSGVGGVISPNGLAASSSSSAAVSSSLSTSFIDWSRKMDNCTITVTMDMSVQRLLHTFKALGNHQVLVTHSGGMIMAMPSPLNAAVPSSASHLPSGGGGGGVPSSSPAEITASASAAPPFAPSSSSGGISLEGIITRKDLMLYVKANAHSRHYHERLVKDEQRRVERGRAAYGGGGGGGNAGRR